MKTSAVYAHNLTANVSLMLAIWVLSHLFLKDPIYFSG